MNVTLIWKGNPFEMRVLERNTFIQVAMTFLSVFICFMDFAHSRRDIRKAFLQEV